MSSALMLRPLGEQGGKDGSEKDRARFRRLMMRASRWSKEDQEWHDRLLDARPAWVVRLIEERFVERA
jgi:hypothetical protein